MNEESRRRVARERVSVAVKGMGMGVGDEGDCPVEITVALVEALIVSQFPEWAALPIRSVVPGGWDNRTFRLGDDLLVRLPSHARYVAQVAKEQTWLPRLRSRLAVPIPEPVALGQPAHGYPWAWSVYRWLDGEPASRAECADSVTLAEELAEFSSALRDLDSSGGPAPGEHNFYRGGALLTYDRDVRQALGALGGSVDSTACERVWQAALGSVPMRPAEWLHGDVAAGNLLVREARLAAVLDFGCMAVGDVACDLTVAWTLFSERARAVFRKRVALDEGTWERARGWALWKALILIAWQGGPADQIADAQRVLGAVLRE